MHWRLGAVALTNEQAGAVAAFTIDLLVYPLDTLKTRYQSQDYIKTDARNYLNKPFALRGLYQGIGSVILATLPAGEVALIVLLFGEITYTVQLDSSSLHMKAQRALSPGHCLSQSLSCTHPPRRLQRWPHVWY